MRDPPFRFDVYLRKINKNLNQNVGDLLKYIDDGLNVTLVIDYEA